VVLHLYKEALEKVPFFRGQHPQFITSVVTFLQLEYYAPGDVVVRQGEFGDSMYFLAQGSLEVRCTADSMMLVSCTLKAVRSVPATLL